MGVNLSGRSFLKLLDFTPAEINYLLDLSREFKNMKRNGVPHRYLEGKNVVLLFQKTSTRTRCSFEVGAMDLGMGVTYLDPNSSQMGKKESIQDSAYVFGRMFDGIEFRGFKQSDVEDLAKYSGIPVWNGLTDDFHPTQMLADVLTIQEEFGQNVKGKKMVFFGDARNNVANSLMVVSAKLGMHFVACGPKELMPAEDLVKTCKEVAKETGAIIELTSDAKAAAKDADVLYTDIWVSMGEPVEKWQERIDILKPYQVNKELMACAKDTAIFLHCLPSYHDRNTENGEWVYETFGMDGVEVTNDVIYGPQSRCFEEAENRMHTIKAVMYATLK